MLERKSNIESIEVVIDYLPIANGGKFAWLEDGITSRRYIMCKVIMKDKREMMIIEK